MGFQTSPHVFVRVNPSIMQDRSTAKKSYDDIQRYVRHYDVISQTHLPRSWPPATWTVGIKEVAELAHYFDFVPERDNLYKH